MASRPASLTRAIRRVHRDFRHLAASFGRLGPILASQLNEAPGLGATARKRPRLTAAHRAALKLQGRYMGTLRGLKPRQRSRVKRVRAAKGIRAAIAEARRMAG